MVQYILQHWVFTYFWYCKIVANMAHMELIFSCQPLQIMPLMNILYHMKSNALSNRAFNQEIVDMLHDIL